MKMSQCNNSNVLSLSLSHSTAVLSCSSDKTLYLGELQ